jgi:hypothetical protein
MADVGCSDDEDDGSKNGEGDYTPKGPDKTTSSVADSKHGNANAGFDGDGAGAVEELGDKE